MVRQLRRNLHAQRVALLRACARVSPVASCLRLRIIPTAISRTISVDRSPSRRPKTSSASSTHERNLATFAEQSSVPEIPFVPTGNFSFHQLPAFDPSKLVKVIPRVSDNFQVRASLALPNELDDILVYFSSCISVGKLERAGLALERLQDYAPISLEPRIMSMHNELLSAWIYMLQGRPELDQSNVAAIHHWYTHNIRKRNLPETPETIAYMLKAALLFKDQDKLKDGVRHYMRKLSVNDRRRVLMTEGILTDSDRRDIIKTDRTYQSLTAHFNFEEDTPDQEHRPVLPPETPSTSTTQILETEQKSAGLRTLKNTLSLFDIIPQDVNVATLSPDEGIEIQRRLELDCAHSAIIRWRAEWEEAKKSKVFNMGMSPTLKQYEYEWHQALVAEIEAQIKKSAAIEKNPDSSVTIEKDIAWVVPIFQQAKPDRLAALTIITVLSSMTLSGASSGIALTTIILAIARVVEQDLRMQEMARQGITPRPPPRVGPIRVQPSKLRPKMTRAAKQAARLHPDEPKIEEDVMETIKTPGGKSPKLFHQGSTERSRRKIQLQSSADFKPQSWPDQLKVKVGAVLLDCLLRSAKINAVKVDEQTKQKITEIHPAFSRAVMLRRGRRQGGVFIHEHIVKMAQKEPHGASLAKNVPMVVPPKPWTGLYEGGYYEGKYSLMRFKLHDIDQKIFAKEALRTGNIPMVLRALDILGKTGWIINKPVLDVMTQAWNTGEPIAGLPPLNPNIPIPLEPETDNPNLRRIWLRAVKAVENEKSGIHSQRCYVNFQLETAKAFKNQTFYLPHNVDFRGRAYPMPPYLNHMGADNIRGLLKFAKGRPLGDGGLRWLKVHLANVYGFDKASLHDREAFATDHLVEIFDSADKPLDGDKWWMKAEDPWQCLATCFELKAAISSPDPTKFVSHMPVHQDGTCNGLQHYAALGGDIAGAKQVNLEPGDKPADVYSAVADLVRAQIEEDVKEGDNYAKALLGKITRKVVKQTVMTNVYGVTFIGARDQVLRQLESLYPDLTRESGCTYQALASYVAKLIFSALSNMFRGAHDIQGWLGEVGDRICKSVTADQVDLIMKGLVVPPKAKEDIPGRNLEKRETVKTKSNKAQPKWADHLRSTIVWTTPLGMPVAQPYRKNHIRTIATSLQDIRITSPDHFAPVDKRKQLQAFPPNFIHSLDASHMLLSALQCDELGLTFAAVHDSFWTHAADIDTMNRVLRDAFVAIHSEDVIRRLAEELNERYGNSLSLTKISTKTDVGKLIIKWRKENPMTMMEEMEMERQRLELLRSTNSKQRKLGQKMVTPGSIFDKDAEAENSISLDSRRIGLKLGYIPTVKEMEDEAKAARERESGEGASGEPDGEDSMESEEEEAGEESLDDGDGIGDEATKTGSLSILPEDKGVIKPQVLDRFGSSKFEAKVVLGTVEKSNIKYTSSIQAWLPLRLPPLPTRGSFDVTRLKKSQYFFS